MLTSRGFSFASQHIHVHVLSWSSGLLCGHALVDCAVCGQIGFCWSLGMVRRQLLYGLVILYRRVHGFSIAPLPLCWFGMVTPLLPGFL